MKKLLVFAILLCLVLASCAPMSSIGGTGHVGPSANPTVIVPQTGASVPTVAAPVQPVGAPAVKGIPYFDHIILILLENRDSESLYMRANISTVMDGEYYRKFQQALNCIGIEE